jgi:hypothetical protein
MKKLLLSIVILSGSLKAQLTITDSLDFSQISSLLQGFGTNITNTVYNCDSASVAQFSGVSELPNTNGLLLSTGRADQVAFGSAFFSSSAMSGGPGSDPDMMSLTTMQTFDACILEFDCTPLGDTLLFNYTFASEEYPEYVGSAFNDAFGIFLTGPGYSNVNIAMIPGTPLPVAVNNVNQTANVAYYYDNMFGQYCSFDGFTISLTSVTPVTANQTYHFKIGVADASDQIYDTGVFLEAYSFRSNMSLGTKPVSTNEISFMADAATGNISLRYRNPAAQNQSLEIFDLGGKKVFSTNLNAGSLSQLINPGELSGGIYFARVLNAGMQVFTAKFVRAK